MSSLGHLNSEQREAVSHTEGPLLILAGAGTGKTRVITERAAYLVREHGVPASGVLNVTFTNKAAREMRERIAKRLGDAGTAEKNRRGNRVRAGAGDPGMTICTFHSLGVTLLREFGTRVGLSRGFSIYTRSDQLTLVRAALREVGEDGHKPEAVHGVISAAKTAGAEPKPIDELSQLAAAVYPHYQDMLRQCNAVDFDDLLLLTLRLLDEHSDVSETVRGRFLFVQVDEYQDTNDIQLRLLKCIALPRRNICVVGDDDQSIYAWRGAQVRNILQFDRAFGTKQQPVKVVRLEQNYRSSAKILAAANAVIANNPVRAQKTLRSTRGDGFPVRIIAAADDTEEARAVVDHIERVVGKGCRYNDCAVLLRAASLSRPFEEQLRGRQIPYTMIGGQKYFDRKEVRDALGYLALLVNERDDAALMRVINYPTRGIGKQTLDALSRLARGSNASLAKALRVATREELREHGAPETGGKALVAFAELLADYRRKLAAGTAQAEVAAALLAEVRLNDALALQYAKDPVEVNRRQQNVQGVVQSLSDYCARPEFRKPDGSPPGLVEYLERVALVDDSDSADKSTRLARDNVVLITIHSCKGLEFANVFCVGMEEGILPHRRAEEERDDGIDEERRLAYVAMTRAMEHLTLTFAQTRNLRGRNSSSKPSRFLDEIPPECLETERAEIDRAARFQSFVGRVKNLLGEPGQSQS